MSPFSSRTRRTNDGEVRGLLRVHAGRRLVEQQQLRVGRERARDLEPALVAVREVPGAVLVAARQPAVDEQLARALAGLRLLPPAPCGVRRIEPRIPPCSRQCMPTSTFSSAVICAKRRMFWNVRPIPSAVIACGGMPGDLGPVEHDRARRRLVDAREQVEERRLAGAVRPDQRDDRAARDREVDVVGRDEAAELLAELRDHDEVVGGHQSSLRSRSVSVPSVWTS